MKIILSRLMYDRFTGFNLNLELITHMDIHTIVRVTPPFWYAVFRGDLDGTQLAQRVGTQKFCYIVRRHQFLL